MSIKPTLKTKPKFPRYLIGQVTFTSHRRELQDSLEGVDHIQVAGQVQRSKGSLHPFQNEFLVGKEFNNSPCITTS